MTLIRFRYAHGGGQGARPFEKIPKYNTVNRLNGHSHIGIYSPLEVIQYDNS